MAKYLISTVETYRADSEGEAAQIINEAKACNDWNLSKYSSVKKERKIKGEVVDEWYKVSLVKIFDDEKEPSGTMEVNYTIGGAF